MGLQDLICEETAGKKKGCRNWAYSRLEKRRYVSVSNTSIKKKGIIYKYIVDDQEIMMRTNWKDLRTSQTSSIRNYSI